MGPRLVSFRCHCTAYLLQESESPASDTSEVQGGILGFSIEIHLTCSRSNAGASLFAHNLDYIGDNPGHSRRLAPDRDLKTGRRQL